MSYPIGQYMCITTAKIWVFTPNTPLDTKSTWSPGWIITGGGTPRVYNNIWYYPMNNGGYTTDMNLFVAVPNSFTIQPYTCVSTCPMFDFDNGAPHLVGSNFNPGATYIGGGTPRYFEGNWFYPMDNTNTRYTHIMNSFIVTACPAGDYTCVMLGDKWSMNDAGLPVKTGDKFIPGSSYTSNGTARCIDNAPYYSMGEYYTSSMDHFIDYNPPSNCQVGTYQCTAQTIMWSLLDGIPLDRGFSFTAGSIYSGGGTPQYANGAWYYPMGFGLYTTNINNFTSYVAPPVEPNMSGTYAAKYVNDTWVKTELIHNGYPIFEISNDYAGIFNAGQINIFDGVKETGVCEDGFGGFCSPRMYHHCSSDGWTDDSDGFIYVSSGYIPMKRGTYVMAPYGSYVPGYSVTGMFNGHPIFQRQDTIESVPAGTEIELEDIVYYGWNGGYDNDDSETTNLTGLIHWYDTEYGYANNTSGLVYCYPIGYYQCTSSTILWAINDGVPNNTGQNFISGTMYVGGGTPQYVNGVWYYPMGGLYTTNMDIFSATDTPAEVNFPVGQYQCISANTRWVINDGIPYSTPSNFLLGSIYLGGGTSQCIDGIWYYPMDGCYTISMSSFIAYVPTQEPCPVAEYQCASANLIWSINGGLPYSTPSSFMPGVLYSGGGTPTSILGTFYYPMAAAYTTSMGFFTKR